MDLSVKYGYLTPKELCEKYPSFTRQWLKRRIWMRRENGLEVAVRKIGKKIFIHEEKFFEWIESHGRQGGEGE
jgi:hypothetical protein